MVAVPEVLRELSTPQVGVRSWLARPLSHQHEDIASGLASLRCHMWLSHVHADMTGQTAPLHAVATVGDHHDLSGRANAGG
eukprot:COSAG01_NODE_1642_length_9641_cov_14.964682_12_plen_81_part_00